MSQDDELPAVTRMTATDVEKAVNQWCAILTATVGVKQIKVYGFNRGPIYHKVWWADSGTRQAGMYSFLEEISKGVHEGRGYQFGKSVVAFVRKKDGVVFRADSWKKRGREIGDIRDILVKADEGTLHVTGGKL